MNNCKICKNWNIINDNWLYICLDCGVVLSYEYKSDNLNYNECVKRYKYKRTTYLIFLINNINIYYINNDDFIDNLYETVKENIEFDYWKNKKYLKKEKLLNSNNYNLIYYFMHKKFKNDYKFINQNLKIIIINLFLKIEKIFIENKRQIKKLKKKILNYNFILWKIFIMIDKPEYIKYIELPEKWINDKLEEIWKTFFIFN